MNMICPKCGGEAFLTDEEFVQVIEKVDPVKVVLRAIHTCRSCTERFSRLIFEDINARPRPAYVQQPPGAYPQPYNPYQARPVAQPQQPAYARADRQVAEEGLRFLDKI